LGLFFHVQRSRCLERQCSFPSAPLYAPFFHPGVCCDFPRSLVDSASYLATRSSPGPSAYSPMPAPP
jgi:hypothetical protein